MAKSEIITVAFTDADAASVDEIEIDDCHNPLVARTLSFVRRSVARPDLIEIGT